MSVGEVRAVLGAASTERHAPVHRRIAMTLLHRGLMRALISPFLHVLHQMLVNLFDSCVQLAPLVVAMHT